LPLSSAYKQRGLFALQKNRNMIQFVAVILKDIFDQEKNYPWKKPSKCPRCKLDRIWGHGFVPALFDGFDEPLLLKRYRCPECNCVITMRPASHFSRFQAAIVTIRLAIYNRITHGKWPPNYTSSRMRHWLNNLKRQIRAHLPQSRQLELMPSFDFLLNMKKNPVSRSI